MIDTDRLENDRERINELIALVKDREIKPETALLFITYIINTWNI